MKNFVFISPNFPETYFHFCESLKKNGFRVLGVGDAPYEQLSEGLKHSLDEYYLCNDMNNFANEVEALRYFESKYGHIDYIESNNEYWLAKDAKLREIFNVDTGVKGSEIDLYQCKSLMKEKYREAKVKCADYIIVNNKEQVIAFAEKVGYPIFIKPNRGVGADGTYKISNINDLNHFFGSKDPNTEYICEQYITGNICTFDGICNSRSEVIFATSEVFPPSIADVLHNQLDVFYYCLPEVPKDMLEIGKRVIKAFKVKNRFFHLEFFRLTQDVKGVGKVNDIVALETNMRAPGGYTPDLINFANSTNCYQIWADGFAFDENHQDMTHKKYYAGCASRRDGNQYFYSDEDIYRTFKNNLCFAGRYPDVFSGAMGNSFYMAKFENEKDLFVFRDFVSKKVGDWSSLNKTRTNKDENEPICDRHIDGA